MVTLVKDLVKRARCKIWSLAKLREVGATRDQLTSVYITRVRSTVEYAAQVYHSLLNELQSSEIEDIQRASLQIILGTESQSYEKNLSTLGLSSLSERRCLLVKNAWTEKTFGCLFRDTKQHLRRRMGKVSISQL